MSRSTTYTSVPRVSARDEDADRGFLGHDTARYDDHDASARRLSTSTTTDHRPVLDLRSSTLGPECAPHHESKASILDLLSTKHD